MNKLQVIINQEPGSIHFNFEELKEQLSTKMAEYQNAIFTEESKQIAKGELASLRKLKESVDKRRKEVKSQCMQPYTEFETKVKELLAIIDEPIVLIDRQLKEMEAERVQKRKKDVRKLWEEIVKDGADYLPFDEIYDKKWNLAGTSLKSIRKDLEDMVSKVTSDIAIISSSQSDVAEEALDLYKKDRDLTKALIHINTYEANKKKALEREAERQRQEEEHRKQAEIERAKAEERQKMAEIERARKEEQEKAGKEAILKDAPDKPCEPFQTGDDIDDLPFEQPSTVTAFYKVVATREELAQVEMAFNSIGIYFERREA